MLGKDREEEKYKMFVHFPHSGAPFINSPLPPLFKTAPSLPYHFQSRPMYISRETLLHEK